MGENYDKELELLRENVKDLYKKVSEGNERQNKIEVSLARIEGNVDKLDYKITSLAESMKSLKTDLESYINTPRQRWNTLVITIITSTVSGLVGAFIGFIIKGVK